MKLSYSKITIVILICALLMIFKCKNDKIYKLKEDNFIKENNIEVLLDTVKTFRTKNGDLISERSVLISDKKNLKKLNKNLYDEINSLEKEIDNFKPQVVIKTKTKIKNDTIYLKSNLSNINDSSYIIKFNKDTIFNHNNSRKIEGLISINLINDSSIYNTIKLNEILLTKDEINIDGTIVLGMKDDKLKVWFKSSYPGLETSSIDAVTLDPKIHPELRKLNNKRIGIGPYIGVGFSENFKINPTIGIGVQYSIIKF